MEMRRSKITGKSSKTIKPLSRGKAKGQVDSAVGFWQLLAGKLAVQKDGEDPKVRGERLEPVALKLLADKFNLSMSYDPGMWLSDDHEDIAITPDGAEDAPQPIWAAEAKALDSALHLKFVIKDLRAQRAEGYYPLDSIPNEYASCFKEQCIQYFVVNEHLQTLYFVLYDDRIVLDKYTLHVITIKREEVIEEIEVQKQLQLETLSEVDKLIALLAEE